MRVYPTRASQEVIDRALSVKARSAELLCAYIDVQPVNFNRGFFTVDVRYFYRITADAFVGAARPVEVCGLAVFDKRVILFGSEGSAKIFSSQSGNCSCSNGNNLPTAELEAVDPLILNLKLVNICDCRPCDCNIAEIPAYINEAFGDDLMQGGDERRLYVTLGQFSIIRLERDTHLLMPVYDYCMPEKECSAGGCGCDCECETCDCGCDDDPQRWSPEGLLPLWLQLLALMFPSGRPYSGRPFTYLLLPLPFFDLEYH